MPSTLAPIEPPYEPEVANLLSSYPQRGGVLLTLFKTFANSARFLKKGVPNLLDADSPLALREREIVILRVTARKNCEYEWGVHVAAFAKQAGFTEAQVAATRLDAATAPVWSEAEQRLIRAVDELCDTATLSEKTLVDFQNDWSVPQQLEILAVCGAYNTVSLVANVARLPGEPFGARFPKV